MGSLWVDKYRPHDLAKLTYHREQAEQLAHFVNAGDFPHLLFCGPSGAGKRTRIYCLLKKLYGPGAENVRMDMHEFQTNAGKKLQIQVLNSNYHIELTPGDVGMYDRIIVQEVIKEMASVQQINRTNQKAFKVIVLMEAENLSKDAQHALRRTMEKYASTCKLILCCESSSRIIDPLRSRCMYVRVPAPVTTEVKECISFVCQKERLRVSDAMIDRLAQRAEGNVRRALLLLEGTVTQNGIDLDKQPIIEPEWESYLRETAKIVVQKKTSDGVLEVRQRFYEMLCRCIAPQTIFVKMLEEFMKICDPAIVADVVAAAAKFEHSCRLGSKPIYHLEAFVAAYMDIVTNVRTS